MILTKYKFKVLTCILVYRGLRDFCEFSVGSNVVVLLVMEARPGLDHRELPNLRLPKW